MSSTSVFDAYSSYYNLLYQDKDYLEEVGYFDSLLKEHGESVTNLLEFGSGTGVHGRLLAKNGYNVTGIELSEKMVLKARQTSGFNCQHGDIRTINLKCNFDAVLALFHVVSYQTENKDVSAVFMRAEEHLQKGGLFVFDVWYTPAVYYLKPETRVKRMADDRMEVIRIAEPNIIPNENRVDVNYTCFVKDKKSNVYQNFSEIHPMRHFSLPEIDRLSADFGFERIVAEELITANLPSENTWGVCFVLKKL